MTIGPRALKNASRNGPHDNAEYEEAHSEESVVDGHFFRPLVATSEVVPEDENTECHGDARNTKYQILRPNLSILSPSWEVVPWRQVFSSIEYRQGCRE